MGHPAGVAFLANEPLVCTCSVDAPSPGEPWSMDILCICHGYIYIYYRCWCLWKWGWWWWWWWIISNFLWVRNDHIMPFQSDNDDKPSDFIPSSKIIPNTHPHVHTYLYNVFLVGGLEHFLFSIMYGIILPIDFHIFQDGYCTTNQIIMWQTQ